MAPSSVITRAEHAFVELLYFQDAYSHDNVFNHASNPAMVGTRFTSSDLSTEVKQDWARTVMEWGTTRNYLCCSRGSDFNTA